MTTDAPDRAAPLAGVRVLNLGTRWPGRVAAMLLADQGADVVEIVRPGRESHAVDPLLDRGKRLVELDLKNEAARSVCRDRAAEADVAIENMRPGAAAALGLDYAALGGERSGLVHISLPGFAEGDPMRDVPAWEGTVCAAVGVYSDISPLGALLGRPVYTAIPMASAYGGVLGSLAASLGLYRRQRTGCGQHIEVPL
ncbi:MAG: carnitine dehydratase, partial [Rhodospirillaceae bacterium]|nr:carnitine dehydratase [Rhodospirillaceae bacterium]